MSGKVPKLSQANGMKWSFKPNKRPQAKCPPTCEMSVCGEYVYNMYVKNAIKGMAKYLPPPPPPLKTFPLIKHTMGLFK